MLCLFFFLSASNQHLKEQPKVFVYSVANPNAAKLLRRIITLLRSTIKVTITNNPRILTLASSEVSPFKITILGWALKSFQDFLMMLDMKPRMHLVETSIFSLNPVIVTPTKIMNRADKNWADFLKIKFIKSS